MPSNDYVTEAESRQLKCSRRAPCVYQSWNDRLNKDSDFYPNVNCSFDCDSCGWNPDVKKRRVEKMREELRRKKKAIEWK